MLQRNNTLDSTGPLIIEDVGLWQGNNSALIAGEVQNFYDGTISLTDSLGGHAYFIFNGTAIYLYGTQGPLYGEYSVSIDEKVVFNGYSGRDQLLFQQLLYSNANLPMGLHNVTLTNTWSNAARNFTDIDYLIWTTEFGESNSVISSQTIGWDNSTAWQYGGAWNVNTTNFTMFPEFSSGSRATASPDSSATLTFEGDAITVYGATSKYMGQYYVLLDSSGRLDYTARHDEVNSGVIIFYADNLGPGQHQVTFVNNPATSSTTVGSTLLIEKAVILTASSMPLTHKSNTGMIAGVAVGGIAVIALAMLAFLLLKRHKNLSTEQLEIDPDTYLTFEPYSEVPINPDSESNMLLNAPPRLASSDPIPRRKGQPITVTELVHRDGANATPSSHLMADIGNSEEAPPVYSL